MNINQTNNNAGDVVNAVVPTGYNGFNPAFLFGALFGLGRQWRLREFAEAEKYRIECECTEDKTVTMMRAIGCIVMEVNPSEKFYVEMRTHEFRFPHKVSMDGWNRLQIQAGKCEKCGVVHWACCDPTTLIRLSEKRLIVVQQDERKFQVRVVED